MKKIIILLALMISYAGFSQTQNTSRVTGYFEHYDGTSYTFKSKAVDGKKINEASKLYKFNVIDDKLIQKFNLQKQKKSRNMFAVTYVTEVKTVNGIEQESLRIVDVEQYN